MPINPRTPQGVLELLPAQQIAFQRMLDTIRRGFERFGFLPIETPTFELTEILLTKSGGETEKQVYFVQSTGSLEKAAAGPDTKRPELALRFDLTVPLARYVAEHEHELNFPFRRYQIQRVYRGERAQKGRFREFYQCDIDVIGKDTLPLAYDAEIPAIIHGIFTELGFGAFTIRVNNRKLLRGALAQFGIAPELHGAAMHEIDRLGKVEPAEVARLLAAATSIAEDQAHELVTFLGSFALADEAPDWNADFTAGLRELREVVERAAALGAPLEIDLSIARGLDYYTGTVYETFLDAQPKLGSICSGGRYDNLAEHYTKSKLPGVGISIGVTRLLSQLLEAEATGAPVKRATAQVMVLNFDAALAAEYATLATELRARFNVELYGGADKPGKQLKYADRSGVPLAVILGGREHAAGVVKIKDLRVTDQHAQNEFEVPRGEVVAKIAELLGHA